MRRAATSQVDDQGGQTDRSSRRWRRATGCIVAPIVLLGVLITLGMIPGWRAGAQAFDRSVEVLAEVTTIEEATAAVGVLGVVLVRPNGEWVAIRYTDSHSWPGFFSCSVARSSDNRWYRSWNHYCGLFAGMRSMDQLDEYSDPELRARAINGSSDLTLLEAIRTAPSLDDAERSLLELGFRRFEGPR